MMFTDTTDIDVVTTSILWKINNIKHLTKLKKHGEYESSRVFYSPKDPSVKWKVNVYPNGYPGAYHGDVYVSITKVGLKDEDETVRACYHFSAQQTNGINKEIGRYTEDFKNLDESSKCNINMLNFHLADGSIKILCEIEYLNKSKDEYLENDFSCTSSTLKNIWLKETFTDCVINIGTEKINAHRCILAQNSEVFRTMFEQNGMIEGQSGVVKIDDFSYECFKVMLEFCYTGIVSKDVMENIGFDLFYLAHKYELTQLKNKCEYFMASIIDKSNFVQLCSVLDMYGSEILEEFNLQYQIYLKFEVLAQAAAFFNLLVL